MDLRIVEKADLERVADKIRSHTGSEEAIMFPDGFEAGVDEVYIKGNFDEQNAFWDRYQNYGNRRIYHRAFNNSGFFGWGDEIFKPKYDIICEGDCSFAFYAWEKETTHTNIGAILKKQGVILDTSKAKSIDKFFAYGSCIIGELPTISCESAGSNTTSVFRNTQVKTIEKVIVTNDTNYFEWFMYCDKLENIVFDGVIAKNGLNTQWSTKLSKDSCISIINALSTVTSNLTVTFSNVAVNKAFETASGANDGSTSAEWLALIATRSNWTIALA